MLAQNAEPTGTTADLAALGEEDEDMSEMRILEQKAAKKQHLEAMAEKAGGECKIVSLVFNKFSRWHTVCEFKSPATFARWLQETVRRRDQEHRRD